MELYIDTDRGKDCFFDEDAHPILFITDKQKQTLDFSTDELLRLRILVDVLLSNNIKQIENPTNWDSYGGYEWPTKSLKSKAKKIIEKYEESPGGIIKYKSIK